MQWNQSLMNMLVIHEHLESVLVFDKVAPLALAAIAVMDLGHLSAVEVALQQLPIEPRIASHSQNALQCDQRHLVQFQRSKGAMIPKQSKAKQNEFVLSTK